MIKAFLVLDEPRHEKLTAAQLSFRALAGM